MILHYSIKKTGKYINEQFPPEIDERRKQIFPVMLEFKNSKTNDKYNKCVLVRDKLYVNGLLYNLESDSLKDPKLTMKNFNGNPDVERTKTHVKRSSNSSHATTRDISRNENRKPNRPYLNQEIHRGRDTERKYIDFSTPNRYSALNRERSESLQRSKHKARSPLEETDIKRAHVDNCLIEGASSPYNDQTTPKLLSPQVGPHIDSINSGGAIINSSSPGH
jgi:hypothetical protein